MAVLLLTLLISLAMMFGCSSGTEGLSDMSDSVLRETLDRACRAGADCSSIKRNGVCFYPNTSIVTSKGKDRAQGSCDFNGTVVAIATDPTVMPLPPSRSKSPPTTTTPVSIYSPHTSSQISGYELHMLHTFLALQNKEADSISLFLARVTWRVCRTDISDEILEKTLRSACRAGADCKPIKNNGVCYTPNTVKAHCTYAVSSYYQRKARAQGTCDSAGAAPLVTSYN
ncbi:hypothetical protein ACLOJK_002468 [Asimina triloba]